MNSGEVNVEFCSSHCNHACQVSHLPISDNFKKQISAKLSLGVGEEEILNQIRCGCSELDGICREHLVTRQDILNIKRRLNIESVRKHADDHTSVYAWVEEFKKEVYNPILYYKPQGVDCPAGNLHNSDFLLVLQTEFQKDLFLEHGSHVVCMDATHGTNLYNFQLITILIMDSLGEGIPVAWAIGNHENTQLLTVFLSSIKDKIGSIKPNIFMSDDADQYFNSWVSVFGTNSTKKLLCAWHVDRAWRKSLARHVKEIDDRSKIYHHLRVILLQQDEATFRLKLQQTMSYLLEVQPRFCEYFQREFASPSRINLWATFERVNSGINTNMMIESFHRKLKVCYMMNKQNRRIDSLLNILIRISRDMVFEYLLKKEKGKYTHRLREINKRHKTAKEMIISGVKLQHSDEHEWSVPSQTKSDVYYTVREQRLECTCPLSCATCGACIHMYTCSCIDQALHSTVCKHIHIVHSLNTGNASIDDVEFAPPPDCDSALLPLQHYVINGNNPISYKSKVLENLSVLNSLIDNCNDDSILKAVSGHISSAVNVLSALQDNPGEHFKVTKKCAPNTNNETQNRFRTAAKHTKKSANTLVKPNDDQQFLVDTFLSTVDVKVCGYCFCENDRALDETIKWTQCQRCSVWYHQSCLNGGDTCSNYGEEVHALTIN